MFRAVKEVGGLDVQLVYFRGLGETRASKWVGDPEALARLMTGVSCQGGYTQIRKVLTHARRENEQIKVNAVIYVGDCMEEDIDELSQRAGELGLLGVPLFLFQEGREPKAERAFKEIARLTRGAYCRSIPAPRGSCASCWRRLRCTRPAAARHCKTTARRRRAAARRNFSNNSPDGSRPCDRGLGRMDPSELRASRPGRNPRCVPRPSIWSSTMTAAAWRAGVSRANSQAERCPR